MISNQFHDTVSLKKVLMRYIRIRDVCNIFVKLPLYQLSAKECISGKTFDCGVRFAKFVDL